jgi:hypothetical protein
MHFYWHAVNLSIIFDHGYLGDYHRVLKIIVAPVQQNSIFTYLPLFSTIISLIITAISVASVVHKNHKDNIDREKSQAAKISAWITSPKEGSKRNRVVIQNTSSTPIYDVLIIAIAITGAAIHDGEEAMEFNKDSYEKYCKKETKESSYNDAYPYIAFQQIPPGLYIKELGFLEKAMHVSFGLEIAFTDVRGNYWKMDSHGKLSPLKNNYLYEKYHLENPTPWESIDYFDDRIDKKG